MRNPDWGEIRESAMRAPGKKKEKRFTIRERGKKDSPGSYVNENYGQRLPGR